MTQFWEILTWERIEVMFIFGYEEPQGQLARWLEELSQYNMILKYRPGKVHGNADALSRKPMADMCSHYSSHVKIEEIVVAIPIVSE